PVAYLAQSNTTCPVEWFEMFILKNRELLTNPSDVVTIMIHWSWVTRPAAHAPNPERPSRADTTSPRYRDRRRQLRHHRPPRRARGATAHGRAAAGQRERGHLHDLAGPHRAGLGQHDQRVLPRPSRRLPVLRHPAPGLRGDTGRHDGVGALLDVGMGGRPGLVRRNDQRPDVAPTTRPPRLPAALAASADTALLPAADAAARAGDRRGALPARPRLHVPGRLRIPRYGGRQRRGARSFGPAPDDHPAHRLDHGRDHRAGPRGTPLLALQRPR